MSSNQTRAQSLEYCAEGEHEWQEARAEIGIAAAKLISISEYDQGRRTYLADGVVYKLDLHNRVSSSLFRSQDLQGEYNLLMHCRGCYGVSEAVGYRSTSRWHCLMITYFAGVSLANSPARRLSATEFFRLIRAGIGISLRGVAHNDIRPGNILLSSDGNVCLIDFDQGKVMAVHRAFWFNIFGVRMANSGVFGSCLTIAKSELRKRMSPRFVRLIKRLMGRESANEKLPSIPADAAPSLRLMYKAWDIAQVSGASAPGTQLAYYSLNFGGYYFPGERRWEDRWEYLRKITDYRGKRILELGCNMGLLSCALLKEAGANAAMGVDVDGDILSAARLVADAKGVHPEYEQVNFDSPVAWEDKLSQFRPDIVFALNVLNWVEDKQRFLEFLGRFTECIFEGHDDPEVEIARLKGIGFSEVMMVMRSERGRPVIRAMK